MTDSHSDTLVFFGATGDLAYKKIFPALQAMVQRGHLQAPVIGVAKAPLPGRVAGSVGNRCARALNIPARTLRSRCQSEFHCSSSCSVCARTFRGLSTISAKNRAWM